MPVRPSSSCQWEAFLESGQLSDLKLKVSEERLEVHSQILAARSSGAFGELKNPSCLRFEAVEEGFQLEQNEVTHG